MYQSQTILNYKPQNSCRKVQSIKSSLSYLIFSLLRWRHTSTQNWQEMVKFSWTWITHIDHDKARVLSRSPFAICRSCLGNQQKFLCIYISNELDLGTEFLRKPQILFCQEAYYHNGNHKTIKFLRKLPLFCQEAY